MQPHLAIWGEVNGTTVLDYSIAMRWACALATLHPGVLGLTIAQTKGAACQFRYLPLHGDRAGIASRYVARHAPLVLDAWNIHGGPYHRHSRTHSLTAGARAQRARGSC